MASIGFMAGLRRRGLEQIGPQGLLARDLRDTAKQRSFMLGLHLASGIDQSREVRCGRSRPKKKKRKRLAKLAILYYIMVRKILILLKGGEIMNAVLLINDNDKVVVCFKPLTPDEVQDLDNLGLSVKGDGLNYLHLPLFAIRKGDLCYSIDRANGWDTHGIEEDESAYDLDMGEELMENLTAEQFGDKTRPQN